MQKYTKWGLNSFLVGISLLLSIGLGELILRVVKPHDFFAGMYPSMERSIYWPNPLDGIDSLYEVSSNEFAYRSESYFSKDRYGILTIGGSTTECLALSDQKTWSFLLERKLNKRPISTKVTIGNLGRSGLNSGHHYWHLKQIAPQFENIRMAVVLVGINDYLRVFTLGEHYYPTMEDPMLFRRAFPRYPRQFSEKWYQQTEWWMHLRDVKNSDIFSGQNMEVPNVIAASREDVIVLDKLPDLSFAVADYRKSLLQLIRVAKEMNVELVLMNQPSFWPMDKEELVPSFFANSYPAFCLPILNGYTYTPRVFAEGMALFNETLLEVAKQEQVQYIDLAKMIPQTEDMYYDCCHFKENGTKAVADILYPVLDTLIQQGY